jgi:mRNA-degrading endonuclease RelE of RelBE toxin-antitoxin system
MEGGHSLFVNQRVGGWGYHPPPQGTGHQICQNFLGFCREIPHEFATRILDDLEGFADSLDYKRYDVRRIVDSPESAPRYRMRSGNYRVTFFIIHTRLIIEVIAIRLKKSDMDY